MPSAFRTKTGEPALEINGIGLVAENGEGGVPLETAALRMPELQDKNGKPLTGSKLTDAAKEWADTVGLTVAAVADDNLTTSLPAGNPPASQES